MILSESGKQALEGSSDDQDEVSLDRPALAPGPKKCPLCWFLARKCTTIYSDECQECSHDVNTTCQGKMTWEEFKHKYQSEEYKAWLHKRFTERRCLACWKYSYTGDQDPTRCQACCANNYACSTPFTIEEAFEAAKDRSHTFLSAIEKKFNQGFQPCLNPGGSKPGRRTRGVNLTDAQIESLLGGSISEDLVKGKGVKPTPIKSQSIPTVSTTSAVNVSKNGNSGVKSSKSSSNTQSRPALPKARDSTKETTTQETTTQLRSQTNTSSEEKVVDTVTIATTRDRRTKGKNIINYFQLPPEFGEID